MGSRLPAIYRSPAAAWAGVAFVLAVAAAIPGSRSRVDLRAVCDLQEAGRFGVSCNLTHGPSRVPRPPWLRTSFVVFEDGIPLRDVDHSRQVRRQGLGTYVIELETLWFSSMDGTSPLENGHEYQGVVGGPVGGWLPPWARGAAAGLALFAFLMAFSRSPKAGYACALPFMAVCLVLQARGALDYTPVHIDAGSSLPTARAVAAGAVPYRDILFNYTPLGVLALAGWGTLGPSGGVPAHSFALILILLMEAACTYQVFKLCRALRVSAGLAGTVALSYWSMFLWFDGSRILLEPMYLFLVLSGLRALIAWPDGRGPLLAGGLASMALLVKQYGGFGFWGALFAVPALRRPAAGALRVILGSALVLAGVSGLLMAAGVDLRILVEQTAGSNYARRWETVWIELFFSYAPFLAVAPVLYLRREWRQTPGVFILGAYLVASWLPLIVRQHQYYLQNPSPFLFISFAVLVSLVALKAPSGRGRWVEIAAVLCLLSVPVRAVPRVIEWMPPIRGQQERRAILMTSFWPKGQPVLMFAAPSFLALTGYTSPAPSVLGYRFLRESTLDQLRAGMDHATAAWVDPNSMYAGGDFARVGSSRQEELERHGFRLQMLLEDRYELWTKRGVPPAREPPEVIEVE